MYRMVMLNLLGNNPLVEKDARLRVASTAEVGYSSDVVVQLRVRDWDEFQTHNAVAGGSPEDTAIDKVFVLMDNVFLEFLNMLSGVYQNSLRR